MTKAAGRKYAEVLAVVAAPEPLPGVGGMTPHAGPDPYQGPAEELRKRRFGI
ncbi:hypothetical protein PUR61_34885 [Streptomyces sp. BE20]|uniref:hypothetical protein n=1 Tax=unclassified Streptomyces TaxID=2593676 RepID=UPI002E787B68|nr:MULTISPECIES: hypothetical protein [unclassified Streptomyces]MED7954663.1 hypothetical protein [Streptomyces sp. BE303]MEE1827340.1 hypothetical protein [Streptomyces sp. BE20]